MMLRFVTVAALATGAALFCVPAQSQTGTSSQTPTNPPAAGSMGSGGNTTMPSSNAPSGATMGGNAGSMGSQSGTASGQSGMGTGSMGSGSMSGQTNTRDGAGGMSQQAQAPRRMRGGAAAERQMTDCLNNAAAQGQPLSTCKR